MLAYTAYKQYQKHQAKKARENPPNIGEQQQHGESWEGRGKESQHSQSSWTLQEKSTLPPEFAQKLSVLRRISGFGFLLAIFECSS